MNRRNGIREVAFFCLRFLAILVPCLIVWWWFLLPQYLWLVGQFAGSILNVIQAPPIVGLSVRIMPDSVLNTDTLLVFHVKGGAERTINYARMVNSLPPFVVLVLATGGLRLFRRVAILLIGTLTMFLGQGFFLTGQYFFSDQIAGATEMPVAFAQFWLTAPFILWFVLAYWDRIGGILGDTEDGGQKTERKK